MKKLFLVTLLFTSVVFADSTYFSTSMFYVNGDYSDGNYSNSYAGYLTAGNNSLRLLLSYENITLSDDGLKYNQQYLNAGGILGFPNFYVKLNYGHASGNYTQKSAQLPYDDHNNLASLDAFYTDYFTYAGANFVYQKQDGYVNKIIKQYMLRLEHIPHWRVMLAIKPMYTEVSDGRKLFALNGRIHYLPFDDVLLKFHGFYGERAYFFDPDLLILYNKDETQKYLAAAQVEYFLTYNLNLVGGVQHTSFGLYDINYYILGIRTNLIF